MALQQASAKLGASPTGYKDGAAALDSAGKKAGLPTNGGYYRFRHLFAERMKDLINIERLATMMRTSVAMLETTYGKHADSTFSAILANASKDV